MMIHRMKTMVCTVNVIVVDKDHEKRGVSIDTANLSMQSITAIIIRLENLPIMVLILSVMSVVTDNSHEERVKNIDVANLSMLGTVTQHCLKMFQTIFVILSALSIINIDLGEGVNIDDVANLEMRSSGTRPKII